MTEVDDSSHPMLLAHATRWSKSSRKGGKKLLATPPSTSHGTVAGNSARLGSKHCAHGFREIFLFFHLVFSSAFLTASLCIGVCQDMCLPMPSSRFLLGGGSSTKRSRSPGVIESTRRLSSTGLSTSDVRSPERFL
jgi:hypothetical protein